MANKPLTSSSMPKRYLLKNPPIYSSIETGGSVPWPPENGEQTQNRANNLAIDGRRPRAVESRRREFLCNRKFSWYLLVFVSSISVIGLFVNIFVARNPQKELLVAVEKNNVTRVLQLLEQGKVDVNALLPEYQGRGALHLAAQHGHVRLVRFLLAHGAIATLRSSNRDWRSPLHLAANMECRPEIVLMLLDAGAKPEEMDGSGNEAINYKTTGECHAAIYERSKLKKWADGWKEKWRKVDELVNEPVDSELDVKLKNALRQRLDRIISIIRSDDEWDGLNVVD